jgi:hypothetical protein
MLNKMLLLTIELIIRKVAGFLKPLASALMAKLAKTGFELAQQNLGKDLLRDLCTTLTQLREKLIDENTHLELISSHGRHVHVNCKIKFEVNQLHFCSTTGGTYHSSITRPVVEPPTGASISAQSLIIQLVMPSSLAAQAILG